MGSERDSAERDSADRESAERESAASSSQPQIQAMLQRAIRSHFKNSDSKQ